MKAEPKGKQPEEYVVEALNLVNEAIEMEKKNDIKNAEMNYSRAIAILQVQLG